MLRQIRLSKFIKNMWNKFKKKTKNSRRFKSGGEDKDQEKLAI